MKITIKFFTAIFLLIFSFSFARADKISILDKKFQAEIKNIEAKLDGVLGVAIKELKTGKMFLLNEKEIFPQASSIKIALLLEIFKQVEEGRLKLDEMIPLQESQKVEGSGVLFQLGYPSLSLSVKDLCVLMIILSDNTATNILIDKVGMDNVNKRMDSLGLKNTRLRRKMMDRKAAMAGNENISTPLEMMTLLEKIRNETAIKDPQRLELLKILALVNESKDSPIKEAIPANIPVASKHGELEMVRCDSGIVELKDHPYVICVMTTYLKSEKAGEEVITQISKLAFEYFVQIQNSSEYGRLLY
jgi:beta-lactamase class A